MMAFILPAGSISISNSWVTALAPSLLIHGRATTAFTALNKHHCPFLSTTIVSLKSGYRTATTQHFKSTRQSHNMYLGMTRIETTRRKR